MAKDYELMIAGHKNIYTGSARQIKIYYSEPENGIDKDTGFLLLIAGFGGQPQSNVYQKMRTQFADKYNLVCIQCGYFGYEYMQIENKGETLENFPDMSTMQALDNITALLSVMGDLKERGKSYNTGKVIVYGQSHGSYLAHLCNGFAPNLFTFLIDNSAYIFPLYLKQPRMLTAFYPDKTRKTIHIKYLAGAVKEIDRDIINLESLYSYFTNKCPIICYQGKQDDIVRHSVKRKFCNSIPLCEYKEIGVEQVDGKVFKSANHGDADFLELFDLAMENRIFSYDQELNLPAVKFRSIYKNIIQVDYTNNLPAYSLSKV